MADVKIVVSAALIISCAFLALPLIIAVLKAVLHRHDPADKETSSDFKRKLIVFSAFLIASIWSLRFAVGYYRISTAENVLTPFEELFNSLIHTLQTFSMDEDYTDYIENGRAMMAALFGSESDLIGAYGVFASVLNFIAPIAGGAIILEILVSIFPTIMLKLSYLAACKEKYFFSELNEATLALIRSFREEYRDFKNKPVFIIADSSIDDENESSVEMANKAKLMGAICIKNDIVHVPKNRFGKRTIFLMDEAEDNNIHSLVELSNKMKGRQVESTAIYYFSSNGMHTYIDRQVRDNFAKNSGCDSQVILSLNSRRNLVANLLRDIPLFEPIVDKYNENRKSGKQTDLNITILGTGKIGTEMLLASYWCGQMLDCRLHITVISKETENEFWQRIDYLNPELARSVHAGDPILDIYTEKENAPEGAPTVSPIYCELKYKPADVKSNEFMGMLNTDDAISATDYFFVALGSDAENIEIANKLRERIGHRHMMDNNGAKTVITYVVYNSEMCTALNSKKAYSYCGKGVDIYMKAVGSIDEVYSVKNLLMIETKPLANKSHDMYYSSMAEGARNKNSKDMKKDEYAYQANIARALHGHYKVFSSGKWENSIFDSLPDYEQRKSEYIDAYHQAITTAKTEADQTLLHELAWLEHRRWNAFMRTMGFRCPEKADEFIKNRRSQKDLELKLHTCLVECDKLGMKADMTAPGQWENYKLLDTALGEDEAKLGALRPDRLDEVTSKAACILANTYDYKLYDYPLEDFR